MFGVDLNAGLRHMQRLAGWRFRSLHMGRSSPALFGVILQEFSGPMRPHQISARLVGIGTCSESASLVSSRFTRSLR